MIIKSEDSLLISLYARYEYNDAGHLKQKRHLKGRRLKRELVAADTIY